MYSFTVTWCGIVETIEKYPKCSSLISISPKVMPSRDGKYLTKIRNFSCAIHFVIFSLENAFRIESVECFVNIYIFFYLMYFNHKISISFLNIKLIKVYK